MQLNVLCSVIKPHFIMHQLSQLHSEFQKVTKLDDAGYACSENTTTSNQHTSVLWCPLLMSKIITPVWLYNHRGLF